MKTPKATKNPIIAAVLNIIFPGVGYLYAGVRKYFALLLIAGLVLSVLSSFDPQSAWYVEAAPIATTFLENISALLILAAFGYDAYAETKSLT